MKLRLLKRLRTSPPNMTVRRKKILQRRRARRAKKRKKRVKRAKMKMNRKNQKRAMNKLKKSSIREVTKQTS